VEHCVLVLADGRTFPGRSFGAPALTIDDIRTRLAAADADSGSGPLLATIGEVVFNTAMSGYVEVLTDPSYTGQIVAMTYPHIGNYGVSPEWSESNPEGLAVRDANSSAMKPGLAVRDANSSAMKPGSAKPRPVCPAGFVVRSVYDGPVPDGRQRLTDFLADAGIPGITGVDTRALTLHLRNKGSQNGLICRAAGGEDGLSRKELAAAKDVLAAFPAMEGRGLIGEVGARQPREIAVPEAMGRKKGAGPGPHLVLYDCGAKENIIRELQALGCRLTLLPSESTADEIRAVGADGVMISNGPGDPAVLKHQVEQTRQLLGEMPVLGICLGHQIIAEAAGAKTGKMKFGHHGVNHPVRDELTRRVFVTSQNHGFTVDEKTLPRGLDVWFRNANDQSIEGLRDESRRIRTTQFHPESAPGPTDSRWIFEAFLEALPGYTAPTDSGGSAPDERSGIPKPSGSTSPKNPRKKDRA
jgi:carbamoyl-phosphate synthase small subunit